MLPLTIDDSLRYLLCAVSLFTLYRNVKNFFILVASIEAGRAKDFDVFYIPILLSNTFLSMFLFVTVGVNGNKIVSSQGCNESIGIFISSVLSGCNFQIAINWLEVTSE